MERARNIQLCNMLVNENWVDLEAIPFQKYGGKSFLICNHTPGTMEPNDGISQLLRD
jgi:hypothetical protein